MEIEKQWDVARAASDAAYDDAAYDDAAKAAYATALDAAVYAAANADIASVFVICFS